MLQAVLGAIREHYPEAAPEMIPMQAPEHFELEATTRAIEVRASTCSLYALMTRLYPYLCRN